MTGLFIALIGVALLIVAVRLWHRDRDRSDQPDEAALPDAPLTPEIWEPILQERFLLFRWLPAELRPRLHERIADFLADKRFEACGGLERVTDEMRVLIAAQACLLLVGRPQDPVFPRLRSILVYPSAFRDRGRRVFGLEDGDDTEREIRLGESWHGSVILAWDSVREGAAGSDDGVNVVMHEFAHQLDQADGSVDGAPLLDRGADYTDWAEVLRRDYESLVHAANDPRADPLLDPYGAEDPAEFFAVATETFFELSEALRDEHPDLYRKLSDFYGLDPATWECDPR
ncbi:MAG: zinc-dependent peptidase [Verrucomicrobiales bacterium]|nr:zinc-dependent peptidase [Verrucomicrobiales bacterium]